MKYKIILILFLFFSCSNIDDKPQIKNEPPIVILTDDSYFYIYKGDVFQEPGYIALDDNDGDITEQVIITSDLNSNIAGIYYINYNVTDSDGLKSEEIIRTVEVVELKNIIFCIGDGMGPEQIRAAGMFQDGIEGGLSFETFPIQTLMTTYSSNIEITDSAAAATALATGQKVNNGVLSIQLPGDSSNIPTLLEYYKDKDFYTGLITSTFITHATPAAFASHQISRNNYDLIGLEYFQTTKPNLLLGGVSTELAELNNYEVVTNELELNEYNNNSDSLFLSGQFGLNNIPYDFDGTGALPGLTDMVIKALDLLTQYSKEFFLVIEGGRIDHASHGNDLERMVYETIEFSNSVKVVQDWAKNRRDTLIIVTSDHETGGLSIISNNGVGNLPEVSWSTGSHTATDVRVFASGYKEDEFITVEDNTDFYDIITGL